MRRCLQAFIDERRRPSGVRGPVERLAFCLLVHARAVGVTMVQTPFIDDDVPLWSGVERRSASLYRLIIVAHGDSGL